MAIVSATASASGDCTVNAIGITVVHFVATASGSCTAILIPVLTVQSSGECVALAIGVTIRPVPDIPPPDVPSLICAWWMNN